ncbi:hypothetical protein ETB97_000387 [Aspergillus alliaceus]|uniref:Uncharacterized protein n=1 Tax=Petromyces alliaceus TaxID=209559 RepID=A0A8H6A7N1_PETAA|nr:hypothetical protein ETB97_000387 [Aspergillus burnettii]
MLESQIEDVYPTTPMRQGIIFLATVRPGTILRSFTGVGVQPIWDTYALTLLCTPASNESVYVEAVYDATVVPKMQLRRVMTPFLHTLTRTTQSSN